MRLLWRIRAILPQHMPDEAYLPIENERIIDCGAYNGDTMPNHKIYLRNYVGIIEYVFYAVPANRVLLK